MPTRSRALLCCLAGLGFAATVAAADAGRPLFQADTPLAVTIEAPWRELLRHREAKNRHPAVLAYTDARGHTHRIETTVETRGLTRLRVCTFPPVRLRFDRSATKGTVFEGQRALKVVTHCGNARRWEQYYVLEMLAYRIYNLVTEHSFRVRPLDITYRDSAGGEPDGPRFAFLIEPMRDMARRTGRKRAGQTEFAPGDFDAPALSRFILFQYLIGNTDWAVLSGPKDDACCHNVRVTAADASPGVIAVPYDLDSSGLVDASYAVPHQSLPIGNVTERLFRGFCVHNHALAAARAEFLGHRQAILALVRSEPRLSESRRSKALGYVEAFYATLESEPRFAREVNASCRK